MNYSYDKTAAEMFGTAIKQFRLSHSPQKLSQETLCRIVNNKVGESSIYRLYQRKLSRIEQGKELIFLPAKTVNALKDLCNISEDITDTYLQAIKAETQVRSTPLLRVNGEGNLITEKSSNDITLYLGEYYCYYISTETRNNAIVKAKLLIGHEMNEIDSSGCPACFMIFNSNGQEIKRYVGQFLVNTHYGAWYCILIGKEKQEMSFLVASHLRQTLGINYFNMALALTTSAGRKKYPTVHRMVLSRKELNPRELRIVRSQLKLNSEILRISESELDDMRKKVLIKLGKSKRGAEKRQLASLLYYIDIIKTRAKKEVFYSFNESMIYKDATSPKQEKDRGYVLSKLRSITDDHFTSKIGETPYKICMEEIIKNK